MSNDIAKALKQKTDAMLRLQGQSQKPVVYENVDGSYTAPEKSDYTAVLAEGENIQILNSGSIKTIKAIIPQATETKLGGIKAKEKTTETSEVAIDPETGRLYAPASGGGGTDAESILTKPINITDFTGKDGYILAYNETSGTFYLKKDEGTGGGGYTIGWNPVFYSQVVITTISKPV